MNLITLYLGLIVFLATLGELYANEICYKSKTCIHNGVEKCAVDEQNTPRRFLDSCDILEYNCLKGTDYKKTSLDVCASLPLLDDSETSHKATINKVDDSSDSE